MSAKRYALVSLRTGTAEQIARYLPGNYDKCGYVPHDPTATDVRAVGPCILIEGEDSHGWTLDDYVIPRLASGLHQAIEVSADDPTLAPLVLETAKARLTAATTEAAELAQRLEDADMHPQAAGLATACDIGVSAAFMFKVDAGAYDDATAVVRQAIETARSGS